MKQVLHIISLRTVRHSDKHNIVRAYSREQGNVAFAVSAGKTAEAMRRRAMLMPLGVVECVGVRRPGSDIMMMSDARSIYQGASMRLDPAKNAVTLFVAEFLGVVLREGAPDERMYDFLTACIKVLDGASGRGVANFHICFLVGMARMLGVMPDTEGYREGMLFDMLDGCFRVTAPLHSRWLNANESRGAAMLGRMNFGNMHRYRYSRKERNDVLDGILRYYESHYGGVRDMKSPGVLRELF